MKAYHSLRGFLRWLRWGDIEAEPGARIKALEAERESLREENADMKVTLAIWLEGNQDGMLARHDSNIVKRTREHLEEVSR